MQVRGTVHSHRSISYLTVSWLPVGKMIYFDEHTLLSRGMSMNKRDVPKKLFPGLGRL